MIGGRIVRWMPHRQFGFVHGDDGQDIFVHLRELVRGGVDEPIQVGTKLMFEIGKRNDGRTYATNIRLAGDAPKPDAFFKTIQQVEG